MSLNYHLNIKIKKIAYLNGYMTTIDELVVRARCMPLLCACLDCGFQPSLSPTFVFRKHFLFLLVMKMCWILYYHVKYTLNFHVITLVT